MLFSTPEVATTPTILLMCNGQCLCLCMTMYVYGCCLLRLVYVYGCETWCECVYGWFLYAYGKETWLIVFVVDDRDPIIVKICWLMYCICVCDFCVLKIGYKLEMRAFSNPGKPLFLAAFSSRWKLVHIIFEGFFWPPKLRWCKFWWQIIFDSFKGGRQKWRKVILVA
jgi:hypothetical protein